MSTMVENMNDVLVSLRINGKCISAKAHRHLAFYDVKLGEGDSVCRLEGRVREIALGLGSKTFPIVKPIPSLGIVRLQVATNDSEKLCLLWMLSGRQYPPTMGLPFLLGESDEGEALWMDMTTNPHLLVAGGTGSGKSVLLHAIIANASVIDALHVRPIKLYLIDPKRVEFNSYEKLDVVKSISYDYMSALEMLAGIEAEMDMRYEKMQAIGIRNIADSDEFLWNNPYLLVVIDEAADLMQQDKKVGRFEELVVRLAQKGRAAGIHIVLATQRPSVDVITGLIKANFPARIACKVASRTDSQVVLDMPGAELLLGRGDALLRNSVHDRVRFQVAYIDPKDILINDQYLRNLAN